MGPGHLQQSTRLSLFLTGSLKNHKETSQNGFARSQTKTYIAGHCKHYCKGRLAACLGTLISRNYAYKLPIQSSRCIYSGRFFMSGSAQVGRHGHFCSQLLRAGLLLCQDQQLIISSLQFREPLGDTHVPALSIL